MGCCEDERGGHSLRLCKAPVLNWGVHTWSHFKWIKRSLFPLFLGPGVALLSAASSHLLCRTETQHALLFHWRLIPTRLPQDAIWRGESQRLHTILGPLQSVLLPHLSSQQVAHLDCTAPCPTHTSCLHPHPNHLTPLSWKEMEPSTYGGGEGHFPVV